MWNSKKYAAMAIVGAGLAVVSAAPASACGGYYGAAYGGCGGYYGAAYAPAFGSLGCGAAPYGYAGTYAYGWPYATSYGISDYGAYGLAGGCGGFYGAAFGGCGYGSYGYAPTYGYAGWGCGRAHRVRGYGYAVASRRSLGHAVASNQLRRPSAVAAKPVQSKIAYRTDLKLTRAD